LTLCKTLHQQLNKVTQALELSLVVQQGAQRKERLSEQSQGMLVKARQSVQHRAA
jgi:hypothetical protein